MFISIIDQTMINTIHTIISFNLLVIIGVNVRAFNVTKVSNAVNPSELVLNKSNHPLSSSLNRGVRGVVYDEHDPFIEHEYHHSVIEPQYIVKVVAPRRRDREVGVKELLLVLAPLAAIPLIGSAALTTFTALFATGGYGRRRKRDLLTRELLSTSFTEIEPKDNDYVNHKQIVNQHNDDLNSLLATSASTGSIGQRISTNDNRHTFPENDLIRRPNVRFGSQTTPKSQLIDITVGNEEINNWKAIDLNAKERTGVQKSNTSATLEHKSVESLVKGFTKHFTQKISSDEKHRHISESLGKREEPLEKGRVEETAQVEPIHKQQQQYNTLYLDSAYRKKTDFRVDPIVSNNNSNESIYQKNESKIFQQNNGFVNNVNKKHKNFRDLGLDSDLNPEESKTMSKPLIDSSNDGKKYDNKPKGEGFQFNTWIPFLTNPYLSDIVKGEERREIQELDIIQKYLNTMGRPDYNDQIIATYLSCNGMLSAGNQCLERLTCQFSDTTNTMKQLEKDVSSLVIYSLLKNDYIDNGFKTRLQRAAYFGKDNPGKCHFYNCPKNNLNKSNKR